MGQQASGSVPVRFSIGMSYARYTNLIVLFVFYMENFHADWIILYFCSTVWDKQDQKE